MSAFNTRIKKIVSSRLVTIVVVAVAMISRVIQLTYFFNIRVDGSFQVMATQSLMKGHGVSIAKVFSQDLSQVVYDPLINWPPGYSFLLLPFYQLTGNYVSACLFLDILFAWLLIFSSRKVLKLLHVQKHLINLHTFITGFFLYYFYVIESTDAIGISIFMYALYIGLRFLRKEKLTAVRIIEFCLLLVALAFLKYLFIPVAFVLPLFLAVYGWENKDRKILRAGIISFAVVLVCVLALLFYQKSVSGSAAYISSPERGFFPGHLKDAYPFIPGAIIQPGSVRGLLTNETTYRLIFIAYQVVHWILFAIFSFYLVIFLLGSRLKNITSIKSYLVISWMVSVVITGLLLLLSLTVAKEEIVPGLFWTYLEEARYYGLPVVLLHGAVFISLVVTQPGRRTGKYIPYLFIVLLLPEALRGLVFDARRVFIGKEEFSWQYEERFQKYADTLIQRRKKEWGVEQVVVAASSYMNSRVSLHNHVPVLYEVEKVNDLDSLHTSKPVLLVVIIDDQKKEKFIPFTSTRKPDGQFDAFTFYSVYVEPH